MHHLATHSPSDLLTRFELYPVWALLGLPVGLIVFAAARAAGLGSQRWQLAVAAIIAVMPALTLGNIELLVLFPVVMLAAFMLSLPTVVALLTTRRPRNAKRLMLAGSIVVALAADIALFLINRQWSNDDDTTSASAIYATLTLILPWLVFAYVQAQLTVRV